MTHMLIHFVLLLITYLHLLTAFFEQVWSYAKCHQHLQQELGGHAQSSANFGGINDSASGSSFFLHLSTHTLLTMSLYLRTLMATKN